MQYLTQCIDFGVKTSNNLNHVIKSVKKRALYCVNRLKMRAITGTARLINRKNAAQLRIAPFVAPTFQIVHFVRRIHIEHNLNCPVIVIIHIEIFKFIFNLQIKIEQKVNLLIKIS